MNGDPSAGRNITPYSDRWEKAGMTKDGRRSDWVDCGGLQDGGYGSESSPGNTTKENLIIDQRKFIELSECMQSRGYQRAPPESIRP